MSKRIFKINKSGPSYDTLYTDVELPCQSCGEIVTKVIYSERSGIGEWICSSMHQSRDVIGV